MSKSFLHEHWTELTTTQAIAVVAVLVPFLGIVVTLLIGFMANRINRRNAANQIEVAERSIYLSLVDTRAQWLEDFRDAVWTRDGELSEETDKIMAGEFGTVSAGQKKIAKQTRQAEWLFDSVVQEKVQIVLSGLDNKMEALSDLRANHLMSGGGDRRSLIEAHQTSLKGLEDALDALSAQMPRFMYVGDITKKTQLKKTLGRGFISLKALKLRQASRSLD